MATFPEITWTSPWMIASAGDAPESMKCPDHALHADEFGQSLNRRVVPVEVMNVNDVRRIVLKFREMPIRPCERRKQLFHHIVETGMIQPAKQTRIHHLRA